MFGDIISLTEIFYLLITTVVIGYIFTGIVQKKPKDILSTKRFDWDDFKFAILVAAPGIILHELAHKFTAMSFGLHSVFEIWPLGLGIGVLLKVFGSGFILLAPGYVTIPATTAFQSMVIAFAGPFINLVLWLGAGYLLKRPHLPRTQTLFLILTQHINKWLFIFNMIPLPPLDGSKVLMGLIQLFF